jgi:hypothetical protein
MDLFHLHASQSAELSLLRRMWHGEDGARLCQTCGFDLEEHRISKEQHKSCDNDEPLKGQW